MADSTSHIVVGVVLRVRGGRLEALIGSAALRRRRAARAGARAGGRRAAARPRRATRDARAARTAASRPRTSGSSRSDSSLDGDWRAADGGRRASRLRRGRAGAAAREAVVHERRLRARAQRVHRSRSCARSTSPALGHDVSATNLQRVLVRRRVLERVEGRRPSGAAGGRPAALFRFASNRLEVTDEFAALRPPQRA